MARFRIQDINSLEQSPTSADALSKKIDAMLISSVDMTATVEGMNRNTGEYRIVLQGRLDKEDSKFDR